MFVFQLRNFLIPFNFCSILVSCYSYFHFNKSFRKCAINRAGQSRHFGSITIMIGAYKKKVIHYELRLFSLFWFDESIDYQSIALIVINNQSIAVIVIGRLEIRLNFIKVVAKSCWLAVTINFLYIIDLFFFIILPILERPFLYSQLLLFISQ